MAPDELKCGASRRYGGALGINQFRPRRGSRQTVIQLEVSCELQDGTEFQDVGAFAFDVNAPTGYCAVELNQSYTSVSVLDEDGAWPNPVHILLARALARSSRSKPTSALTVSAVVHVTVQINLCGIPYDVLEARGDGRQVYDFYGSFVEGPHTRFQVWRLVRQMLQRRNFQLQRAHSELNIYRFGSTEYCRVSELPEELQVAFGICHALSPMPYPPEVTDACYLKDMELFLEMLRLGRGYPPLVLSRRLHGS
ncbi:hypothetical protein [Variovorax saccharolyticus]|uniref:hypothetical protein n=1 Tax=Variovorax saccharolyticus TaxID=3053516 RepID=UPI0025776D8C|nr:hypothetical protein [Variovorax sp. J22R187]MDM0018034.1 hypothetical protein [Variovorax sp. J22R187]